MARTKRMSLAISEETLTTYRDTAELLGVSINKLVCDLLDQSAPAILAMQKPLRTAKNDQLKASAQMVDAVKFINNEVHENQLVMEEFTSKNTPNSTSLT
jgi:hypothetical protein